MGFSLIPAKQNKKPAVKSWTPFKSNPPTDAQIKGWFNSPNVTGLALIAGEVSGGLAIRDFDTKSSYERWAQAYPALSKELGTVRTFKGFHVYCRSDLQKNKKYSDGEFRGSGYTLAPHSLHASGQRYEWIISLPPDGRLQQVEHQVFTRCYDSETSENPKPFSVLSDLSALSVLSDTSLLIQACLPQAPGQRNYCLMNLARALKFNAGLADAPKPALKALVKKWFDLALPIITTKEFDETWADFIHAFKRARLPFGDVLKTAETAIDLNNPPPAANHYTHAPTKMLIALCAALASLHPKGNFFLSSHVAAERAGMSQPQAYRRLQMLVEDGVIQEVEKGEYPRATRYRWPDPWQTGGGR
jgi:hypothetical protein